MTPRTVAHQAPLSMGFSRQEDWSGLPSPSPEDLPHPGVEPRSPALQADSLLSEPPGKPLFTLRMVKYLSNNLKQSWACQVDGHFPGRRDIFYHSYVNFDFSFTLYMIKQALREHSFDSLPFSLRNSAYWRHSVTHCQAVCFHLGALFLKHKITVFFFTAFLHTQSFSIVHFWQVSG